MDENRGPQREQEQKKDGLQEEVQMEENPAEYSFMQEMIKDEAGGKRKIRNDIWIQTVTVRCRKQYPQLLWMQRNR